MKFIFPRNYDYTGKFLGIIDYTTLITNVVWAAFLYCFVNLFINSLTAKIYLFVSFYTPLLLFSIIRYRT